MKDRIPKYPGRVKLTPVNGDGVYDMVRADEPEEAGTPINKNSLLTDETAEELGLSAEDNPTPNDAMAHLAVYTARKTGDILETMRQNPGDRWVLCNGDPVPEEEIPNLREILPYNIEWRSLAPLYASYDTIKPIGRDGFWFLEKSTVTTEHLYCVYDANTDTYYDIECPNASTANDYIRGITYNGSEFVMCVDGNWSVFLYTSSDLLQWTQAFSFASPIAGTAGDYQRPGDIIFVGGYYLILMYGYDSNTATYRGTIYQVDREMTAVSQRHTLSGDGSQYYLRVLPQDHYVYVQKNEYAVSEAAYVLVYNADGTVAFRLYNDNGNRILVPFDDDKILLWSASALYVGSIAATTGSVSASAFETINLFSDAPSSALCEGMLYDRNLDQWKVYLKVRKTSGSTYTYWVSYIAGSADPTVAGNYSEPVQISALPQMPDVISAQNRANGVITDGGIVINDPNIKYLPSHDGDSYKYIYTGVAYD